MAAAVPPPPPPPPPPLPGNPMGYPRRTVAFRVAQSFAGFKHELYRTEGDSTVDWMSPAHVASMQAWRQPRVGGAPFRIAPPAGSTAARALLAASIANRGTVGAGTGAFSTGLPATRPTPAERAAAQATMNNAATTTAFLWNNITFVRQLGWDRDGTTTLWHYQNPAGGTGNLVCKVGLGVGAVAPFMNALTKSDNMVRGLETSNAHAWTDYARHGDLGEWIARVSNQGETFPRSVLWRFFECLTDACVAMAYPPRAQTAVGLRAIYGPDLPENIPAAPLAGYNNIVHTILEPSKVFVEDYDPLAHIDVPRLQVGDFERAVYPDQLGLPNFTPPPGAPDFDRLTRLWFRRSEGKDGWLLPEHFSAEWDHVTYEPYNEGLTNMATGVGAAGAFTEKSNIFHIGMVIWCCMLLHEPETPPRATPVPRSGANMGTRGWTYVGEMNMRQYHGQFGRLLCDLVSDCCKHMPADRPDLTQLRQRVATGVARNPVTNNDIQWVQRTLHNPPPPNPVPGTQPPGAFAPLPF